MSPINRLECLRHLLYEYPSPKTWSLLCKLFHHWPVHEDLDVGLAYAAPHLERWPEKLRIAPFAWTTNLSQGHELPNAWPLVRDVTLPPMDTGALTRLLKSPHMAHITQLHIGNVLLNEQSFRKVCNSPQLTSVAELSIRGNDRLGWHSLESLARSALGQQLTSLKLEDIRPEGYYQYDLENFPQDAFARLKQLELRGCQITNDWLKHMKENPHWRQLTHLALPFNRLQRLCDLQGATFWQGLTHLDLSGNPLHRGGCNDLFLILETSWLQHLTLDRADIHRECLMDAGGFRKPYQLTTLSMRHNRIEDDAMYRLMRAPQVSQLQSISLQGNPYGKKGLGFLISSRHLPYAAKKPYLEALSNGELKDYARHMKIKYPNRISRFQLIDLLLQGSEGMTNLPW